MTKITKLGAGHYRYRNGEPATVLTVERPNTRQSVVSMTQDGTLNFHNHDGRVIGPTCAHAGDLLPIPRKVWVNIFCERGTFGVQRSGGYETEAAADMKALPGRIACVEIELPGEET
jgi:hypothetical protein